MASVRFTILLLMLILIEVRSSTSQNCQGMKANMVIVEGRRMLLKDMLKKDNPVEEEDGELSGGRVSPKYPIKDDITSAFVSLSADYDNPNSHPSIHN
ncbi:hypothetical protein Nepgr_033423 [Nepenthes gracilis]|uniref:Uncharacterized protein n=1 Tax=Nepenthes gracilis TaxID=150966 RepID=A0AAD3TM11_NEPGR|nr:hypothetical protein Nepgr_033423 [Nepenthes gracilis]